MKACGTCKEIKPLDHFFNFSGNKKDGKGSRCKPCDTEARKKWERDNPDRARESRRNRNWKHKYGVTPEQYSSLLKAQDGRCAICLDTENRGFSYFAVDHCHTTGNVRGLLCNQCNRALGLLKDDTEVLTRAIDYLKGTK